jgi:hypothetical protein
MPTGIYIAGIGQSTTKESVEKYAARYIKDLEYSTFGINYYTKVEKIYYNEMHQSNCGDSKSGDSCARLIFK